MESKDFSVFAAIRRLENYLAYERDVLDGFSTNKNIDSSLLFSKIDHYNELILTLNDLFAALSNSRESSLFPLYKCEGKAGDDASIESIKDSLADENEQKTSNKVDNSHPSQIRAAEMLNNYEQTADNNVSHSLVEDTESSPDVLPDNVYRQTVEGVEINKDPTQLADVVTAIEKDGTKGLEPVNMDIASIMYRAKAPSAGSLIDKEIENIDAQSK